MKAVGIILAGGNNERVGKLSSRRAISAMPVGGSFRCIDFALSNMTNSNIRTVAVLTQYNARSLNAHLSSSKWWNFGRKQGGLYLFTPTITEENSDWYRGTADAIAQNLEFLQHRHESYVVIASGDCVYKLDYNTVLNSHISQKADITVVCKDMPVSADIRRYGVVRIDRENRIIDMEEKPSEPKTNTISTGIYVIRRRLLIEMLERAEREKRFDFVTDLLIPSLPQLRVMAFKMNTYWSNIADVGDYFRTNMDFLQPDICKWFFGGEDRIYSKVEDLPPAKFNPGSMVNNSLISSGCIINGTVENSIVFRNSFIGKDCVIRNAVILEGAYISDRSHVENCVMEARGTMRPGSWYVGEKGVMLLNVKDERYS